MNTHSRLLGSAVACLTFASAVAFAAAPLLDQNGNPAGFRTLAIGDAAPDTAQDALFGTD